MKKVFSILALCLLAGCADKAGQAQDCAEKFLGSYLKNDFEGAAQLCSEGFKPEFSMAIEDFKTLSPQIKEMLQEQCGLLKYEITGVQRVNKSDTFIVDYNICRSEPDTSAFKQLELVKSTLMVVGGKVDALNR